MEEKKEDGMGTLKKDRTLLRDERKMEKLKAKLHTDDDCEAPGNSKTLANRNKQTDFTHTQRISQKLYIVQNCSSPPKNSFEIYILKKM